MAARMLHIRRPAQAGFSLIELMISMVIGMVVVGAVLAAYLSSGAGSRASQAMSQVTEDASLALNVLRTGIGMVGYGEPTGVDGAGNFLKNYSGIGLQAGLRGCDQAFTNPEAASINALNCEDGDSGGPDAIAVAFVADARNSVTTGGGVPLDCLGNAIADAGGYYLNYARFYVQGNQLLCRSGEQVDALVENVADVQIRYGVAEQATPNQAREYKIADEMGFDADLVNEFDRVVSVRICVLINSTDEVMDTPMTYLGCNGASVTAGDRRLYRSFTTTIVLQNRLGEMM